MLNLETIGFFLFMEEQERGIENRSKNQNIIPSEDSPREEHYLDQNLFVPE